MTLEVRLLGQADVVAAGRSIKFAKRSTTLALLGYLILQRGRAVARDSLAYTLFPEEDEEGAIAELRRTLYLAGKALPAREASPWLIADNDTVRWNHESGAFVDALAFEQFAQETSTHDHAIETYRGDLLENIYDDWIVVERERLRSRYLNVLCSAIARHRDARDYARALGYAHQLLAADPWREDVARQAMAIRYERGDAPGALAEYDHFLRRLRDEMNVGPMPETIALRQAILRNDPLVGTDRKSAPPQAPLAATPVPTLPFVGRVDERARLGQNWDRAARGYGNVTIISGEAGIGKTRLVGELATLVESEGGRAYCGGTAFPESPPYQCLVEALRAALPVLTAHPMPPLTVAILARMLPELAPDSGTSEIAALAPEREAARLLDAFARAFVHVAASRPLLLVFEDLHWAAGTTIDAIAMIGRRLAKTRALLVGTYRDEEASLAHPVRRLVHALGSDRRVYEMHLDRLERDDVERMLARVGGRFSADATLVDHFHALSEGNPLFLNEAIAGALEALPTPDGSVSKGIRNVITTRVERLNDSARIVAEIAAVCGHGCSVDIVRDVAGFTLSETLAGFNELLDRRLVREAGARDRFDFVFTHHLIGTSIYEAIPPPVRVRRHARIAHVINQQGSDTVAARELARHYDLACMPVEAASWCIAAARDAASVSASDDTVRFASTALRHAPTNVDALLLREEANARQGHRDAQRADLDSLDRLPLADERRFVVMQRRIRLARALGERDAERAAVAALRGAAISGESSYWQAVGAGAQARLSFSNADYDQAKRDAREALTLFAASSAARERIDVLSTLIDACASTGDFLEANRFLLEAQAIAERAGDAAALAETHMQAATMFMPQQRFGDVLVRANEAVSAYRSIGDRVGEARALATLATAAIRLSHWNDARAANRAAAEIFEATGERSGLARVLMNLGMLHARCGDFDEARTLIRSARDLQIQLGDERARAASLLNESFVSLWQGDPQASKILAGEALARAQAIGHTPYQATALANLGAAERDLNRIESAIEHMDEGLRLQLELGRMSDAVSDLADLALAHARRGDLPAAARVAEHVLEVGSPWTESAIFPPYPPWIVACVFHWSGDPRARTVLDVAAAVSRAHASSIDVPELRAHFERLAFIGEIAAAVEHDGWPARQRHGDDL